MSKQKTTATLVRDASTLLQLLVRLKAADENGYVSCVVCGVTRHYKDRMDGGHFISRAKASTRLIEENVHPECKGCNMPGSGHEAGYAAFMINMYGKDFIEYLHKKSREVKKWNRSELLELIDHFKEQIKYHKERLGE